MKQVTSTKKRDLTRERILQTALRLFQEKGFEKTTMRAIAEACDLTPGATYYHFNYKEELVLEFYKRTSQEAMDYNQVILAESDDLKHRFQAMMRFKFEQLLPYRKLVHVLAGGAGDMQDPLSPFSSHTHEIRNEAFQIIEGVIEGSNLKVASVLRPQVTKILWLYQMGIILFWANDQSTNQQRTSTLLNLSLDLIIRLFQISSMPLMGGINQKALQILSLVESCTQPDPQP